MTLQPTRQTALVRELLTTENVYISSLGAVCEIIIPEIRPLLTSEQDLILFSTLETIYTTHKQLYTDLDVVVSNWDDSTSKIGSILLQYTPFFKSYEQYTLAHLKRPEILEQINQNSIIRDKIKTLLLHPRLSRNTDLSSYLILPISRIARYSLLLNELIKYTPSNHIDFNDLKSISNNFAQITKDINTIVTQSTREDQLTQILTSLGLSRTHFITDSGDNGIKRYFICTAELAYKYVPWGKLNDVNNITTLGRVLPSYNVYLTNLNDLNDKIETSKKKKINSINNDDQIDSNNQNNDNNGNNENNETNSNINNINIEEMQYNIRNCRDLLSNHVITYQLHLFNDLILCTSPLSNGKSTLYHVIPLTTGSNVFIGNSYNQDYQNNNSNNNNNHNVDNNLSICITNNNYQFQHKFFFTSSFEANNLFQEITKLIKIIKQQQQQSTSSSSLVRTKNDNVLFSLVQHPINILSSEATMCFNCLDPFSILRHRHTCKFCCQFVCSDCSPNYCNIFKNNNNNNNNDNINNNDMNKKSTTNPSFRICKQCEIINQVHNDDNSNNSNDNNNNNGNSTNNIDSIMIDQSILINSSPKSNNPHYKHLLQYSKMLGIAPDIFIIPNRYYLDSIQCYLLGQNGYYYPVTLFIFTDLLFITTIKQITNDNKITNDVGDGNDVVDGNDAVAVGDNNSFDIKYVFPLDELFNIDNSSPSLLSLTSNSKNKNIKMNSSFQTTLVLEEQHYKDQKNSVYYTHHSICIKRHRSCVKLLLNTAKLKQHVNTLLLSLSIQSKTHAPTNMYEFIKYTNIPMVQSNGSCTICLKKQHVDSNNNNNNTSTNDNLILKTCHFCSLFTCQDCSENTAPIYPSQQCSYHYRCCDTCVILYNPDSIV